MGHVKHFLKGLEQRVKHAPMIASIKPDALRKHAHSEEYFAWLRELSLCQTLALHTTGLFAMSAQDLMAAVSEADRVQEVACIPCTTPCSFSRDAQPIDSRQPAPPSVGLPHGEGNCKVSVHGIEPRMF